MPQVFSPALGEDDTAEAMVALAVKYLDHRPDGVKLVLVVAVELDFHGCIWLPTRGGGGRINGLHFTAGRRLFRISAGLGACLLYCPSAAPKVRFASESGTKFGSVPCDLRKRALIFPAQFFLSVLGGRRESVLDFQPQ